MLSALFLAELRIQIVGAMFFSRCMFKLFLQTNYYIQQFQGFKKELTLDSQLKKMEEGKKYKCSICDFETDQNKIAIEHILKTWHAVVEKRNR